MKNFENYLSELLGDEEKQKLRHALDQNKIVIISGVQQSGKTTLARTLRRFGYTAVEDFDTYEVKLTKPLEFKKRNFEPGLRQNGVILPEEKCPCCGALEPEYYYLGEDEEVMGCSECVYKTDVLF